MDYQQTPSKPAYPPDLCGQCGRYLFGTGRCNWCGITHGSSSPEAPHVVAAREANERP